MTWINITAVGEANEVQMDSYAGPDAAEGVRFRHRPLVSAHSNDMVKDWNIVTDWKPGLPDGHPMKAKP